MRDSIVLKLTGATHSTAIRRSRSWWGTMAVSEGLPADASDDLGESGHSVGRTERHAKLFFMSLRSGPCGCAHQC